MKGLKLSSRKRMAVLVVLAMITALTFLFASRVMGAEGGEVLEHFGLLSLVTPILAIVLSFATKQVVLSLAIAVFVGSTIMSGGNPIQGFFRSADTYIIGTVTDSWNAALLVFILGVGGLVAVMGKMGGTQAIAINMAKRSKNGRNTLFVTWILGILIFFEDMANSLIVGPTMRPVTDQHKVSREKLSYVIDSTAAPVTDMSIISSWIAYELSMIAMAFGSMGMEVNAYTTFLQTVPYRFYNIFAIAMVFMIIFFQRDYGPMYKAEKRAILTGKLYNDNAAPMTSEELEGMNVPEGTPLRMANAIVPIVTFIVSTLVFIWYTGGGMDLPFNWEGIQTAFGDTAADVSILYAVILTSIVAIIMAVAQRILTVRDAIDTWINGCKALLMTDIILVLAWSSGAVMGDLGTGKFIASVLGNSIPAVVLPVVLFIVACFVAFSTGTSFGTTAIMIPIAFPMVMGITGGEVTSLVYATIAAVTSGAIFGDHCSPISDTTIMSSMGSGADLMDHVKTQLPYAITVAVVASVVGYIPAALGVSPIILIPIGVVVLGLIVRFFGKSIKKEDLLKGEGTPSKSST